MFCKLKAVPVAYDHTSDDNHIYLHLVAAGRHYTAAVNVASNTRDSNLYYCFREKGKETYDFFRALKEGEHEATLDYWKEQLIVPSEMKEAVAIGTADNPFGQQLIALTEKCMKDPDSFVVAYGKKWGPQPEEDWLFHFKPAQGIHDIHCNQSSPFHSKWHKEDKPWRDGALFFADGREQTVVGVFTMFR